MVAGKNGWSFWPKLDGMNLNSAHGSSFGKGDEIRQQPVGVRIRQPVGDAFVYHRHASGVPPEQASPAI